MAYLKPRPTPPAVPDQATAQIERINELSKTARTTWLSLLGFLAFVGVTLLSVEDADFFISDRQTDLPIINVAIPTASFFVFAPILGTALFIYLHLYLTRLWDALSEPPPIVDGVPLSEAVMPWLINDFGIAIRGDKATAFKTRSLSWVSHTITFLLVFIAGPFVMLSFWARYWPSHDYAGGLLLGTLAACCIGTALSSGYTAYQRLRVGAEFNGGIGGHGVAIAPWLLIIAGFAYVTEVKTHAIEIPWVAATTPDHSKARIIAAIFFKLSSAKMAEKELVSRPPGWLGYNDRKRAFHKEFCKSEGLPPLVCGPMSAGTNLNAAQEAARTKWANTLGLTNRTEYFESLGAQFETDWRVEHSSQTSSLTKLNLPNRDLRGAKLNLAFLVGADLRNARLEGANLSFAGLEGANLRFARLSGANLRDARLERADLGLTWLEGADLSVAGLEGANLRGAGLEGTDLRQAWLEGANLSGAGLEGANLRGAGLEGADLRYAGLEGTDLRGTGLKSVEWAGATLRSPAHSTDYRGSRDLTQHMLQHVIGNSETLLFPAAGGYLHVWSCWPTDQAPENLETLLNQFSFFRRPLPHELRADEFRAEWLCSDTNPRHPVGTMMDLDDETICVWNQDFTCKAPNGEIIHRAERPPDP